MTRKQQPWFIATCVVIALLLSGCLARCQTRSEEQAPDCLRAEEIESTLREHGADLTVLTREAKAAFLASQQRDGIEVPEEVLDADQLLVALNGDQGLILPVKDGCIIQELSGRGPAVRVRKHLGERI